MLNKDFLSILYVQLSRCVWVLFLILITNVMTTEIQNLIYSIINIIIANIDANVHFITTCPAIQVHSKSLETKQKFAKTFWATEICDLMTGSKI